MCVAFIGRSSGAVSGGTINPSGSLIVDVAARASEKKASYDPGHPWTTVTICVHAYISMSE